MGTAASFSYAQSTDFPLGDEINQIIKPHKIRANKRTLESERTVLFDGGNDEENDDSDHELNMDTAKVKMAPQTEKFLREILTQFFENLMGLDSSVKIDMILKCLEYEVLEEGEVLMTQEKSASKVYIVETGSLSIFINGEFIRTVGVGSIVGELALLHDSNRSATVKSNTACGLRSLSRNVFKKIQTVAISSVELQRSRWMVAAPELSLLSRIELSKLNRALGTQEVKAGEIVFAEGEILDTIYVVEKGIAKISSTLTNPKMLPKEKQSVLGVVCPRRTKQKSVAEMDFGELNVFLEGINNDEDPTEEVNAPNEPPVATEAMEVYPGCIIGLPVLRGKAGIEGGWSWIDEKNGSASKLTMTAVDDMVLVFFKLQTFESIFGSTRKLLLPMSPTRAEARIVPEQIKLINFASKDFDKEKLLGAGSFGIVSLASYLGDTFVEHIPNKKYALKSLSKQTIIDNRQLRRINDEVKLQGQMDCIFIVKLWGHYQTEHTIELVNDAVLGGDLWSVIYDSKFYDERGVPLKQAAFYGACLAFGLEHIHSKGVVYRDLKPENLMICNHTGYLKFIDFGFAKKVPYLKTDSKGIQTIHTKTHTLCGTPEYLSPELIFRLGHDQASDIWTFGVILHEVLMSFTPFAPKRPDNLTELFTTIAMVKKHGTRLHPQLNAHTKSAHTADLITSMLKSEPSQRMGIGSPKEILNHAFFTEALGWEVMNSIMEGVYRSDYIPEQQKLTEKSPTDGAPYTGEQSLFDHW